MSKHNPTEFDGTCPKCGTPRIDYLDKIRNSDDIKVTKYFCSRCNVVMEVDEDDIIVEWYVETT